jgi:exopolyphosphatase/guanosine-5'-triphosphate,3'-diphosphate pyrophosphatase
LRNAVNATAFTAEVFERTGINIRVIPGEEEARLTLAGVGRALQDRMDPDGTGGALESAFVIDIGGGSTEIIATGRDTGPQPLSLPLGAVYLTERFIHHDPPTGQELGRMRHMIAEELGACSASSGKLLVGTAGTITTLAAMDQRLLEYDPVRINGSVLTMDRIDQIVQELSVKPISERKKVPGLEPGREDIILAGAMITAAIMKHFLFNRLVVSDWGLREGILFDLFEKVTRDG